MNVAPYRKSLETPAVPHSCSDGAAVHAIQPNSRSSGGPHLMRRYWWLVRGLMAGEGAHCIGGGLKPPCSPAGYGPDAVLRYSMLCHTILCYTSNVYPLSYTAVLSKKAVTAKSSFRDKLKNT